MKIILLLFIIGVMTMSTASAQKDSSLTFSGYAEVYYGFDFNKPGNHNRPGFVYSYNRHNEANLNLGFIKAAYDNGNVRANLALMAGTYANANLANEPGVLKNIFEANAGIKLSKTANLWLDAGIFTSHIGYESAIGKNCWTLTRNIVSDNTPYYESGARLTYTTADNKWVLTGLYLNGWQHIYRPDGNNKPAGGIEVYYTPTSKVTLNYSNYLGTEGADSVGVRRIYHNFYGIFQVTHNFGLTAGFDYGLQQQAVNSGHYYHIMAPVAVARYQFSVKWAAAARIEYYRDQHGVIIAANTPNGFKTAGYSLNLDYAPVPNALIRLEGKVYNSKDNIFIKDGSYTDTSPVITAAFAISF